MIRMDCQHCGETIKLEGGLIESGMAVKCEKCKKSTVIDLFRPVERRRLYAAREIGSLMANVCFNGKQSTEMPQRYRDSMADLSKQWDRKVRR